MTAAISVPGALSRADLASFPDDGRRFELIDGALLVSRLLADGTRRSSAG